MTHENYQCSLLDCKNTELVQMPPCNFCLKSYCLKHRHASDHKCDSEPKVKTEQVTKTQQHVQAILSKPTNSKRTTTGHKSKKTSNMVKLMKLKQKSIGNKDISTMDRVYFDVKLPVRSKLKSINIYVSSQWPIGKMIDNIADHANLMNKNNENPIEKLKLFSSDDGTVFSTEPFIPTIENGSSVILEYSSENVLLNYEDYL